MKSVLRSIKPYWFYLICERIKTIEVAKTFPKSHNWDKRTYLYCSQDKKSLNQIPKDKQEKYRKFLGKVGAVFVCDCIIPISITYSDPDSRIALKEVPYTCLTDKQIMGYLGNGKTGYGWHISDLKIYDEPKELASFKIEDKHRIQRCAARERVYNNPDFTNGAWLNGAYYCNKYNDFCNKCLTKELTRPPQSWCYVEELRE